MDTNGEAAGDSAEEEALKAQLGSMRVGAAVSVRKQSLTVTQQSAQDSMYDDADAFFSSPPPLLFQPPPKGILHNQPQSVKVGILAER